MDLEVVGSSPTSHPKATNKQTFRVCFFVLRALVIREEFASKWGLFFDGTNIQKMRNRQIL